MKVSELQGAALDWAVAKCEGVEVRLFSGNVYPHILRHDNVNYLPSSQWATGGPIMEREGMRLRPDRGWSAAKYWPDGRSEWWSGPTMLIAAMRCYVASKVGPEIEIPKELQP